jgi:HK97 family phage major capsid protein
MATALEKLTELEKQLESVTKAIDQPNYGRVDGEGRQISYFEETDETVSLKFGDTADAVRRKSFRSQVKANNRLLKKSGYAPWGEFKNAGDFIRAGLEGGHAAGKFQDRLKSHCKAIQGMNEGSSAEGGATVIPEFANGIFDRVYGNGLWGMTDNYTVSGNNMTFLANAETSRANGSRHGGLRGYWLGEGATMTASKPTLREINLKLAKLAVVVYLTEELISDSSQAIEQYVTRKASEEFEFMLGDSLINGDGISKPLGILNAPCLVSVAKEAGQLADTLMPENIAKMYARFFAPNMGGMTWLYNQDICPQLQLLTLGIGTSGQVVYMPPGGMSGSPYATLEGRPMMPTEFNATIGDQGDLIAADMGQILSISKGGIAQAVSMHVEFLSDQLALRFTMRVNARPWENAPITPYKGTNTQSNFVTLDAR